LRFESNFEAERQSERESAREGESQSARDNEGGRASRNFPVKLVELSQRVRRGYSRDRATAALRCGTAANLHPTLLSTTRLFISRHSHVLPVLLDTGMDYNTMCVDVSRFPVLFLFAFVSLMFRYGAPPVRFYCTRLPCCVSAAAAAACHLLRFKDICFSSPALLSFPR